MSDHEHIDRIWAIIEKVGVCMLTTRFDVECARGLWKHDPTAPPIVCCLLITVLQSMYD
jgi:hypothetical protein